MKYEKTSWDLSQLMPDFGSTEYELKIQNIQKAVQDFVSSYKDKLSNEISCDDFIKMIRRKEDISFQVFLCNLYAYLKNSQNTQDEQIKKELRRIDELSAYISNELFFVHLWFISLSKEKAYSLADSLGEDSYVFKKKYDAKKYTLSEKEERIITLKDVTGSEFLSNLYDSISSAFRFEYDGKIQTLTQMRQYMLSENRDKRRDSSKLIKEKFSENLHILGDVYQTLVKDYLVESLTLRSYETPLQVRTESEDISQKAVHALFTSAQESNEVFQEFFTLKAKLLSLPKLELYDIHAPIQLTQNEDVPYKEALRNVVEVANDINPKFKDYIEDLIENGHVDSEFLEHKRGGAFNYGVGKGIKPFVFMQYLDKKEDMFTLAHEFGHAIHSMYSLDKSLFSSHSSIGIAESVSTFFEEMLSEHLLETLPDEKQIELLCSQINDAYQTIQRQVYISIFEEKAHNLIQKGTTNQELHTLWTDLQKEQFGDSINISEKLISWSYIPHIYHTPFYCYNYGVGMILALILAKKRKENPEVFSKQFVEYLSVGGTNGTVQTAKVMGIDLEDSYTWKMGYDIIREKMIRLKELVQKKDKV